MLSRIHILNCHDFTSCTVSALTFRILLMIRGHGVSRSTSDNSLKIIYKKLGIDQTSKQTTPEGKLNHIFWLKDNCIFCMIFQINFHGEYRILL